MKIPIGFPTNQKILLSPQELAKLLGISVRSIYNKTSKKSDKMFPIPHVKIGKLLRFRVEDVAQYLENNRQK